MKLTKENVYINLQGKTKEELTELYWLLKSNNEPLTRERLNYFIEYPLEYRYLSLDEESWNGYSGLNNLEEKTEVTIKQLKEIIKPMGTFTPIAMKCTQEQFEAIKPKLTNCKTGLTSDFDRLPYLVNNADNEPLKVYNLKSRKHCNNRTVHEEWNEEIFLKACGIEVDNLEQKLQKAEAEVKMLKKAIEDSKIKVGDWVINEYGVIWRCKELDSRHLLNKIKDQELINKLNELIK